jgi:hypothetical protein
MNFDSVINAGLWHRITVNPAWFGSIPRFPDVREVSWVTTGQRWDPVGQPREHHVVKYNEPAEVVFLGWDCLSDSLGARQEYNGSDSVAVGVVFNTGHRVADSVRVRAITREGEEVILVEPGFVYPVTVPQGRGNPASVELTPGDSAGVPVAPVIQAITWVGGEYRPSE